MRNERKILARVTEYYLSSDEFNGLPIANLLEELDLEVEELKQTLVYLVERDRVEVLFPETDINPHIRNFDEQPKQDQIKKLRRLSEFSLAHAVVYPTKKHLERALDQTLYQGRPFSLRLALGEPELSFLVFDLSVLEFYRNDPRYYYTNDDIEGTISVHDEFSITGQMPESDQLLLQSFGFAYNSQFDRAVAVFLRYLAGLTPEHQQIWSAKLLTGDYELHPDYFRSSILGEFYEGISIFEAFGEELCQ